MEGEDIYANCQHFIFNGKKILIYNEDEDIPRCLLCGRVLCQEQVEAGKKYCCEECEEMDNEVGLSNSKAAE